MSKITPLRRCSLFTDLSFAEVSMIAPFFLEEKHAGGHVLSKEGGATHGMTLVVSGHVILSQASSNLTLRLGMGEFFGEYALVTPDCRSAFKVEADGESEFLRISAADFENLKLKHPALAMRLLEGLLRATTRKILEVKDIISALPDPLG